MDDEDREGLLILGMILTLSIVLPLLILEAPWLLALAMVLVAGYWWQTGTNPVTATLDAIRGEREDESRPVAEPADPLSALRERYARGEIGDEEFERRLDRLLATEPEELHREREREYER
ncbi:SHOCT domain-containing protein [Halalkalicoccus subterraneus]|uniref:SHOCT domain-containing protein n=1 Tax=Halalkalicoccus subterraneus TaxID=2675002 RepID=UPI000EFB680F|nr:SHOCT domain-containing protein [Halalkalicoccus subterraneus]